ncbi:MAG: ArgE/DapE family deacylase [Chloroflexota bacterium]
MTFTIDETFLTNTLVKMVQIDSNNASLTPGAPGEGEIAAYLVDVMTALGLEVTTLEPEPGRVTVVGLLKGSGEGRSLMLNGHIDTVSHDDMDEPLSGAIRDGKLYGRGSQDMKGGVIAMIAAAKALIDANISLAGDLIVAAVADEEAASLGTHELLKHYTADAAIVTEPTDMEICLAHRGFIWHEVEVTGRAAHGSRYDEGIDANIRMGRFLAELDRLEKEIRQREPHPLAGVPSLHAGVLKGGTEVSVYAAKARLEVERRTCPGDTEAEVRQELQTIIDKLAAEDPTFQATVIPFLERPPLETNPEADIVKATSGAMTKFGYNPVHKGASFWTDASLMSAVGIDSILLGPIGDGLHSKEEWVDLKSVVDLSTILVETAIDFCGTVIDEAG